MRVMVTGATTPTGAAVVRRLLAERSVEHVLACAFEAKPSAGVLPRASKRFSYRQVDLTKSRAAHDLLWGPARALGIESIFHTAFHRSALARGRHVHALNVDAARELLLMSARHPTLRRFLFCSSADVYAIRSTAPTLLDEDQPLELDPGAPQFVRDRVEADLTVCARIGRSDLEVVVLRFAEVMAAGTGGQLWDYLRSKVCLRPLGFDPMLNLLTLPDLAEGAARAILGRAHGVYNVPGADTLPLSRVISLWGRVDVPLPGPLLFPLYLLRTRLVGFEFRYDLNARRFHFGGVLDGERARHELGYEPRHPIAWPRVEKDRLEHEGGPP